MSEKKEKKVSIGGQALIEGIMMQGPKGAAMSVRLPSGEIETEMLEVKKLKDKFKPAGWPLIRGIVNMVESLTFGFKCIQKSAEKAGLDDENIPEEEMSKLDKWLSDHFGPKMIAVISGIAMVLGFGLSFLLFVYLPTFLVDIVDKYIFKDALSSLHPLFEGILRMIIFVLYFYFVSLMPDIKRVFMYHGAEHKTISCFESGMPLTVENAKKCSRIHDRCGTTFMVFVMLISIILFAVVESLVGDVEKIYRLLLKIALLPIVAGLSYELLKLLAKTKSPLVFPLKVPGMLLQKITTKNPTDDMIEVAIVAFNTVYEMDRDPSIKEKQFVVSKKRCELLKEVKQTLLEHGITENAESEWIVSLTLGIKRDELDCETFVSPKYIEKINLS